MPRGQYEIVPQHCSGVICYTLMLDTMTLC